MNVNKPSLEELQIELLAICREVATDILMIECLLQYHRGAFSVSGEYTEKDYDLALRRLTEYNDQHILDIATVSNGIKEHLEDLNHE